MTSHREINKRRWLEVALAALGNRRLKVKHRKVHIRTKHFFCLKFVFVSMIKLDLREVFKEILLRTFKFVLFVTESSFFPSAGAKF